MQDKMKKFYNETLEKWKNLDKQQKTKLSITMAIVALTVSFSMFLLLRPEMAVLTQNLTIQETGMIQNELNQAGIRNNLIRNGTAIEVRARDVEQARIHLTQSNIMNDVEFTFEQAIQLSGMGTTEAIKRANLQRNHVSELQSNLTQFEGVDSARIVMDIPEQNNFLIQGDTVASAAIFLTTNRNFDDDQALSIARYVAASTRDLSIDNIEIIDQNARVIFSGSQQSAVGQGQTGIDREAMERQRIRSTIQMSLGPMYDVVNVVDNLVFDWSTSEVLTEMYAPPIPGAEGGGVSSQVLENQSASNINNALEPGLGANNQAVGGIQMGDGMSSEASSRVTDTQYLWNVETERRIVEGDGLVPEQSSIGIITFTNVIYHEEIVMNSDIIEEGMTWEEFKMTRQMTEIEVNPNIIETLIIGTGIPNLSITAYDVPIFYDAEVVPLQLAQILMFVVLAALIFLLAYGLIRRTIVEDEIIEIEPELSVEELLVSSEIEETEEERKLREIQLNGDSDIKRQLSKFVDDKPEAVAQLLRNWINDGWE
jgi:flagellar M-ring protein FliF